MSVVLREVTGCGAEVFPVFRGDGRVRSHADRTSSVLGDVLLDPGVGVHHHESTLPLVLAHEDFDPRGNPVVVDDVVHACIVATYPRCARGKVHKSRKRFEVRRGSRGDDSRA